MTRGGDDAYQQSCGGIGNAIIAATPSLGRLGGAPAHFLCRTAPGEDLQEYNFRNKNFRK